ncbi:MAG: hypothetical protein J6Y89_04545, partial [Lachnospiraceae bacterium]|nr:hypothetical protein [Lachnospiraceae bacterium]
HAKKGHRMALLSLAIPYDVACYENVDAVICAYNSSGNAHDAEGNGPFNLNVAVAFCSAFGQCVPQGHLPVNIPKLTVDDDGNNVYSDDILYKRGSGITDDGNWKK